MSDYDRISPKPNSPNLHHENCMGDSKGELPVRYWDQKGYALRGMRLCYLFFSFSVLDVK